MYNQNDLVNRSQFKCPGVPQCKHYFSFLTWQCLARCQTKLLLTLEILRLKSTFILLKYSLWTQSKKTKFSSELIKEK